MRRAAGRIGMGEHHMSTPLPPSPFIGPCKPSSIEDVLDNLYLEFFPDQVGARREDMIDLEPMPLFVSDPSPADMRAVEIMPIVKVLARH
jgi:hypothetical protein